MKNSEFHFVKHNTTDPRNKNRARRHRIRIHLLFEFIQRKRYNVTTARTSNKFQRRHVFTLSRAYGSPPRGGAARHFLTFPVEN